MASMTLEVDKGVELPEINTPDTTVVLDISDDSVVLVEDKLDAEDDTEAVAVDRHARLSAAAGIVVEAVNGGDKNLDAADGIDSWNGGGAGGREGAIVGSGWIVEGGRGGATVGRGRFRPPPE